LPKLTIKVPDVCQILPEEWYRKSAWFYWFTFKFQKWYGILPYRTVKTHTESRPKTDFNAFCASQNASRSSRRNVSNIGEPMFAV